MKKLLTLLAIVTLAFGFASPASALTIFQPTRSFNSAFQSEEPVIQMDASYCVQIAATLTISGGQTGTVFLEISEDGSTNWMTLSQVTNANSGTLAIGLNLTDTKVMQLRGAIPQYWYARLRTTGTATITYISGLEMYNF